MATNPVPTLSTQGYVSDSANRFAQLFSNFYLSDYNKTLVFAGEISSLPRLLQQAGNDENKLAESVQSEFSNFLSNHYEKSSVVVTVLEDTDKGHGDQLILKIEVTVYEDMVQRQYGYLLRTANAMLQEVVKLNNYGE